MWLFCARQEELPALRLEQPDFNLWDASAVNERPALLAKIAGRRSGTPWLLGS
jgi:hypothetical protein